MSEETTPQEAAPVVKKKVWGLSKAASVLTLMNGKKKKIDIGNTREILASILKHDLKLIDKGGKPEILKALVEEYVKRLAKKGKALEL